ncbi:alpha-ribazole phosphatase [Dysgonomonas massiliensis]|uniref:alpha-ribazole phosphatase n=1 Tax=Dysgonomonas massiliensis TaxID=2040292 RepID=UPI000C77076E|nr:alpha-ribazole phosphatase [Dysgonomonas massiliensis]
MKIYLVRHTAVDVPQGMCYGQTNVPLKPSFEDEARVVKSNIGSIEADVSFSSPLSRCRKLAHFCDFKDAVLDDRLKELHFGDWETRMWDHIDMSIWDKDWVNPPAPNGESFMQMYNRVSKFFDELKSKQYKSVLVFTHGGVISCARVYFNQADIKKTFDLMPRYGEMVQFEF